MPQLSRARLIPFNKTPGLTPNYINDIRYIATQPILM